MIFHPFWRPEPSQTDQKAHPRRNLDFSIDFEPPQASIFKNFQCYSGECLLVSSLSPATLQQPASKGVGGRSALTIDPRGAHFVPKGVFSVPCFPDKRSEGILEPTLRDFGTFLARFWRPDS